MRVVVLDVLGEDCLEVTAAEDEHPVEALAPDGADDALADGVGTRCLDRGSDDPDGVGGEDGVEGGGELGVAIADEELDRVCVVNAYLHRALWTTWRCRTSTLWTCLRRVVSPICGRVGAVLSELAGEGFAQLAIFGLELGAAGP